MKILICGHTSFASQQLPQILREHGHDVTCFGRGPVARASDSVVTGPVDQLENNPHLAGPFDAVVNYILLKDEKIAANEAYVDSLLKLCAARGVKHLVHISSVSSHKGSVALINESAELESDPTAKGSYGSLKVASDLRVLRDLPKGIKLSMVRPGFILGSGLVDPIIGTGVRLPWNKLLVLGAAKTTFPVITRAMVNESILKTLESPPAEDRESLLLVAGNSPTRRSYLHSVSTLLGAGTAATAFPVLAWWILAIGSELVARLIGQSKLKPLSKLSSKLQDQRFDSTQTQKRLGLDFTTDWQKELKRSLDGQETNFIFPDLAALPGKHGSLQSEDFGPSTVTYLGYGRIVKQKHVPALKRLGFTGKITALDLKARVDEDGQEVTAIDAAPITAADLFVVATPGPAHIDAVERLAGVEGTVLVEKPLGYSHWDLSAWDAFAAGRKSPVLVCHNYRYKSNVLDMARFLRQYNPGRLQHVAVDFQSPPVSNDSASWLRNERRARTLLLDYSLHFLDLACMLSAGPWEVGPVRHELNTLGQTRLIQGSMRSDYSVSFLLRQGFAPRRTNLRFSFHNYSVTLGFFPETFSVAMSHDNASLYGAQKKAIGKATRRKILDKLTGRDSDLSHALIYTAAGSSTAAATALTLPRLRSFYDALFQISRAVYGE